LKWSSLARPREYREVGIDSLFLTEAARNCAVFCDSVSGA
jgi:hypothetical protein